MAQPHATQHRAAAPHGATGNPAGDASVVRDAAPYEPIGACWECGDTHPATALRTLPHRPGRFCGECRGRIVHALGVEAGRRIERRKGMRRWRRWCAEALCVAAWAAFIAVAAYVWIAAVGAR